MLSIEYKILSHLHSNGGKCPISYENSLSDDEKTIFDHLRKDRKIAYADGVPDGLGGQTNYQSIILSDKGLMSFLSEKERLDAIDDQTAQDAQHETRERSFSLVKAVFSMLKLLAGLNPAKLIEYIKSILQT